MNVNQLIEAIQNECIELNSTEKNHYHFLKPLLENRKYVFLGESSHTVEDYSLSKIDLIKYLHKELGFNVVAFESELGDCFLGDLLLEEQHIDSYEMMQGAIGKVWQSSANLKLFDYIQQTKKNTTPLKFVGIDVQQSEGKHLRSFLLKNREIPNQLKEIFETFDTRVNEILMMKSSEKKKLENECNELISLGEVFLQSIQENDFRNEKVKKVLIQSITNRINYFKANLEKSFSKLFAYREYLMARNLEYISKEIYPDEKIIIWAHHFHVKKCSSSSMFSPYKSLFENLNNKMKEQSLVIGYYAKEGRYGNPFGEDFQIKRVNKKHLEWLLNHAKYESIFIPCLPSWANAKMKVLEGNIRMSIKPIEQYDGIIFLKSVNPSDFLAK